MASSSSTPPSPPHKTQRTNFEEKNVCHHDNPSIPSPPPLPQQLVEFLEELIPRFNALERSVEEIGLKVERMNQRCRAFRSEVCRHQQDDFFHPVVDPNSDSQNTDSEEDDE